MLSLFQNIKAILAKYFMIFTAVLVVIFVLIGGIFLTFSILRIKDISNNAQKVISNHMRTQTLHNIEWGVNEKKELLETLTAAIEATVGNTTRTTIENLNLAFKSIDISNRNKFNIGIASSNPKREGVWIYGGDFLKTDQNAHFSKYHGLAINEKYMGAIIPNGQGAPYYKKLSRTLYDPFIRIYNLYSGILWVYCGIEKDGGLIGVPLGDTHPRGYDARARNWYKIASNEEDFTWTLPYVESSEQNVVLAGVMPLRNDDKKLLGVLAVDLSLSDAMQLSDLSSLYKGISVLVVDGDGKVVIHDDYDSDEPSMKESVPIIDLDELPLSRSAMEQIENSKVGVIRSDDDQNPGFVVISSPVRNLDWKILAIVPDKILMSDSQAMVSHVMRIMKNVTYSLMLYYLLSLVVSIVVLIFISKRGRKEAGTGYAALEVASGEARTISRG